MEYIGTIENDWKLENAGQILIYGAGKVGKEVLGFLRTKGWQGKVMGFCDHNPEMWKRDVEGFPVFCLSEACAKYPEGTYLVASLCVRQMTESLLLNGIRDIHVIRES